MSQAKRTERAERIGSLLRRHEGPLLRYAARITGDVDLAREVVQEAFLRLCQERGPGRDDRAAAWLYAVCRNRALDVRRKEKRMTSLSDVGEAGCPTADASPLIAAADREAGGAVLRLLAGLPPNQQEVVRLKFQSGLSYKEITKVTRLSVSNVGFLIHTAIKTLRDKLNADSAHEPRAERREP
jgi:RNA polymerase sigma factor (sigma-70 family)